MPNGSQDFFAGKIEATMFDHENRITKLENCIEKLSEDFSELRGVFGFWKWFLPFVVAFIGLLSAIGGQLLTKG